MSYDTDDADDDNLDAPSRGSVSRRRRQAQRDRQQTGAAFDKDDIVYAIYTRDGYGGNVNAVGSAQNTPQTVCRRVHLTDPAYPVTR